MAVVPVQNYPDIAIMGSIYIANAITLAMTGADPNAAMFAYSFVAPKTPFSSGSMKLSTFRWYCSAVTSSPKVTAYLYSDNNGVPNAVIQAGDEVTVSGANAWQDQTWTTKPVLTEGVQYWIVLKCTSGTSATIRTTLATSPFAALTSGSTLPWRASVDSSTDSGSTWGGTDRPTSVGVRVELTNDTDTAYFGAAMNNVTAPQSGTSYRIDASIESGFVLTTAADAKVRIKTVALPVRKAGTPGDVVLKIYAGDATSATATSNAIPVGNISTSVGIYHFDFSTPVELAASSKYRFVLSAASGSNSTNYYYTYINPWDTDANSITPLTTRFCVLASGAWTDTVDVVPWVLMLDTIDPFGTIAAGGGPVFGGMVVR